VHHSTKPRRRYGQGGREGSGKERAMKEAGNEAGVAGHKEVEGSEKARRLKPQEEQQRSVRHAAMLKGGWRRPKGECLRRRMAQEEQQEEPLGGRCTIEQV
jgi:hypothetical protein